MFEISGPAQRKLQRFLNSFSCFSVPMRYQKEPTYKVQVVPSRPGLYNFEPGPRANGQNFKHLQRAPLSNAPSAAGAIFRNRRNFSNPKIAAGNPRRNPIMKILTKPPKTTRKTLPRKEHQTGKRDLPQRQRWLFLGNPIPRKNPELGGFRKNFEGTMAGFD